MAIKCRLLHFSIHTRRCAISLKTKRDDKSEFCNEFQMSFLRFFEGVDNFRNYLASRHRAQTEDREEKE